MKKKPIEFSKKGNSSASTISSSSQKDGSLKKLDKLGQSLAKDIDVLNKFLDEKPLLKNEELPINSSPSDPRVKNRSPQLKSPFHANQPKTPQGVKNPDPSSNKQKGNFVRSQTNEKRPYTPKTEKSSRQSPIVAKIQQTGDRRPLNEEKGKPEKSPKSRIEAIKRQENIRPVIVANKNIVLNKEKKKSITTSSSPNGKKERASKTPERPMTGKLSTSPKLGKPMNLKNNVSLRKVHDNGKDYTDDFMINSSFYDVNGYLMLNDSRALANQAIAFDEKKAEEAHTANFFNEAKDYIPEKGTDGKQIDSIIVRINQSRVLADLVVDHGEKAVSETDLKTSTDNLTWIGEKIDDEQTQVKIALQEPIPSQSKREMGDNIEFAATKIETEVNKPEQYHEGTKEEEEFEVNPYISRESYHFSREIKHSPPSSERRQISKGNEELSNSGRCSSEKEIQSTELKEDAEKIPLRIFMLEREKYVPINEEANIYKGSSEMLIDIQHVETEKLEEGDQSKTISSIVQSENYKDDHASEKIFESREIIKNEREVARHEVRRGSELSLFKQAILKTKISLAEELRDFGDVDPNSNMELNMRRNSSRDCFKLDDYEKSAQSNSSARRAELIQLFSQTRDNLSNPKSPLSKWEHRPVSQDSLTLKNTESNESEKGTSKPLVAVYRRGSSLMDEKRSSIMATTDDAISPKKTRNLESLFKDMKPLSADNSFEVVLEEEDENKMEKSNQKEPEEEMFFLRKPTRKLSRYMLNSQKSILPKTNEFQEETQKVTVPMIIAAQQRLSSFSNAHFQKHKEESIKTIILIMKEALKKKKTLVRAKSLEKTVQFDRPINRRFTNELIDLPMNNKLVSLTSSRRASYRVDNSFTSSTPTNSFVNLDDNDIDTKNFNLDTSMKEISVKSSPTRKKMIYKEFDLGMLQEKTLKFDERVEGLLDTYSGTRNELEVVEFLLIGFWGIRIKKFTKKQMTLRRGKLNLEGALKESDEKAENFSTHLELLEIYLMENDLTSAESHIEALGYMFESITTEGESEQLKKNRSRFMILKTWFNLLRTSNENILKRIYHFHVASSSLVESATSDRTTLKFGIAQILLEGNSQFSFSKNENVANKCLELGETLPSYRLLFDFMKSSLLLEERHKETTKKCLDFLSKMIQEGGSFVFICAVRLIYYFRSQENMEKALSVIKYIQKKGLVKEEFHKEFLWSLYVKCIFKYKNESKETHSKEIIEYLERNKQKLLLFYQFGRCIAKYTTENYKIAINALEHVINNATENTDEESLIGAKLWKAKLYSKCLLNRAAAKIFKEVSSSYEALGKNAKSKQREVETNIEEFEKNQKNFNTIIKMILKGEREESFFSELWKSFKRDKSMNELTEYDDFAYKILETAMQKKELAFFEELISYFSLRYESWFLYLNCGYKIFKKYNKSWVLDTEGQAQSSNPVTKFKESKKFHTSWHLNVGQYIGVDPLKFWAFADKPHYGDINLDDSIALLTFKCYSRYKARKGLRILVEYIAEKKNNKISILSYYQCKGFIKIQELLRNGCKDPEKVTLNRGKSRDTDDEFLDNLSYAEILKEGCVPIVKAKSFFYLSLGNLAENKPKSEILESIERYENCLKSFINLDEKHLEKLNFLKKRAEELV